MNFNNDHVNGGGTAIPGVGDVIAANGEGSAIGIGLLRTIVDAHASNVMSLSWLIGTLSHPMKIIMLVPLLMLGIPWARQRSLIA